MARRNMSEAAKSKAAKKAWESRRHGTSGLLSEKMGPGKFVRVDTKKNVKAAITRLNKKPGERPLPKSLKVNERLSALREATARKANVKTRFNKLRDKIIGRHVGKTLAAKKLPAGQKQDATRAVAKQARQRHQAAAKAYINVTSKKK